MKRLTPALGLIIIFILLGIFVFPLKVEAARECVGQWPGSTMDLDVYILDGPLLGSFHASDPNNTGRSEASGTIQVSNGTRLFFSGYAVAPDFGAPSYFTTPYGNTQFFYEGPLAVNRTDSSDPMDLDGFFNWDITGVCQGTVGQNFDGGTGNINVSILVPIQQYGTVVISSRDTSGNPVSTIWTMDGPGSEDWTGSGTDESTTRIANGSYFMTYAAPLAGYNSPQISGQGQYLNPNSTINFQITYEPTSQPPPPGTHLECQNNACVQVSGSGSNLCSSNFNCAPPPPPPPSDAHLECVNNACVQVSGSGSNLCSSNFNCAAPPPPPPGSHLECQNNACVQVSGSGSNLCSSNFNCAAPPPPPPSPPPTPVPGLSCQFPIGSVGLKICSVPEGATFRLTGQCLGGGADQINLWSFFSESFRDYVCQTPPGISQTECGPWFNINADTTPAYRPDYDGGNSVPYTLQCIISDVSATDSVTVIKPTPPPPTPPPTPTPTPIASNITVTQPNFCVSGPAATIGWTYSDPANSPQSAYQVQVDDQGSFNTPEVDSGKIPCQNCRSYSTPQGILQFNTTYRARVRVWNQPDLVSDWAISSSWKTPLFAFPQVDFFFSPSNPAVNFPVQFTDQTQFFDGNPNGRRWNWVFDDGGSSTLQNPQHIFVNERVYNVTLTATDNQNQSCSITKPVNIKLPNPIWKEVNPGG